MIKNFLIFVFCLMKMTNSSNSETTLFFIEMCLKKPENSNCDKFLAENKKLIDLYLKNDDCKNDLSNCIKKNEKIVSLAMESINSSFNTEDKDEDFSNHLSNSLVFCSLNKDIDFCKNLFDNVDFNNLTKELFEI